MKMMKKYLSIVLSAVILIMSFPIVVNATEITDDYERVSLVEQKDERTENSKTFYTSNGTFASIVTTDAICYEDDGKYKDIDNTIVKKDTDTLVNKDNSYSIDLPKTYNSGDSITISKDNVSISLGLIENSISSKAKINNGKSEKVDENSLQNQLYNELNIGKTSSSVVYENICSNIDVEYEVLPNSVKENIIINKAPKANVSFKYSLKTNGATAVLNDDKSISIIFDENEIFIIPAAYMFDSAENISDDIDVVLDEINDSEYVLTYTPDMQWLVDKSTKYPVIIDPDIVISSESTAISDTYISSLQKSTNYRNSSSLYVQGSPNTSGTYRASYFKVNTLPDIPEGVMINNATFGIYKVALGGDEQNNTLTLSSVSSKKENTIEEIKYNNVDTYLNDDYCELDTEFIGYSKGMMEFNITDKVIEWYKNNEENIYLALRGNSTTANHVRFGSSESTSAQKPVITVEYSSGTILNDNVKLHKIDLGYAGTAYINDATGNATVESYKFDYNGLNSNTTLSMFMNSMIPTKNYLNGKIAFNFDESLQSSDNIDGKTAYCQKLADGSQAYYVNTSGDNYINYVTGEEYEIYVEGDSLILKKAPDEDSYSEIKEYSLSNEYLKKYSSKSSFGEATYTTLNYNTNKVLLSITDETEAKYLIDYIENSDRIESIIYTNTQAADHIDSNDDIIPSELRIVPIYDEDGKFESLSTSINNFVLDDATETTNNSNVTVSYGFNEVGAPEYITDENGIVTCFDYDDLGRVTRIYQKISGDSDDKSRTLYHYDYGRNKTIISDAHGNSVCESFNKDGSILSINNSNGYSQFVSDLDENMTVELSEFSRYSQNYIHNGDFESDNDNCFGTAGTIINNGQNSENEDDGENEEISAYNGSGLYRLEDTTASTGASVDKINSTYTASVWVKGENNSTAKLRVINSSDSTSENATLVESDMLSCTGEWQQLSCSVNSNNQKYIGVSIETTGIVYVDCVKIENNVFATDVNMIKNAEFSQNLDNWSTLNATKTSASGRAPACDSGVLALSSFVNGQSYAYQKVSGSFKEGDTFTFGAYSYSTNTLPESPMIDRKVSLSIYASNNNNLTINDLNNLIPIAERVFSTDTQSWEYLADEFTLNRNYSNLYIVASSQYQKGTTYFDGINLINGKFYTCNYTTDKSAFDSVVSQNNKNEVLEIANNFSETNIESDVFDYADHTQHAVLNLKTSNIDESKKFAKFNIFSINKDSIEYSSNALGWIYYYKTDIFKNKIFKYDVTTLDDSIVEAALYDQYGKIYTSKSGKGNDLYQVLYKYDGSLLEKIIMGDWVDSEEHRTVQFNYDDWGNLISVNSIISGDTEYFRFEYDSEGDLIKVVYPNNIQVSLKYDNRGNLIYAEDNIGEIKYKYAYLDDNTKYATYDLVSGDVIIEQKGITSEYNINDKINSFHSYCENSDNGINEIVEGFNKSSVSQNQDNSIVTSQYLTSNEYFKNDSDYICNNTKIVDEFDEFGRLSKRVYYNYKEIESNTGDASQDESENELEGMPNNEIMYAVYEYLDSQSEYYIPTDKYVPMTNIVETANQIQGGDGSTDAVCQSNLIRSIAYYDSDDNRIIEYRFWYDEYGNLVSNTAISDTQEEEGIDFIISSKGYEYRDGMITVEAPLVDSGTAPNKKYIYEYDELGNLEKVKSQNILSVGQETEIVEKLFSYDETSPYSLISVSSQGLDDSFIGIDDNGNIESFLGKDYAYSKNNKLVGFGDIENNFEYTYYSNGLLKTKSGAMEEVDGDNTRQYELTYKYYWNDEKLSFVSINENICSVNNNQQENVSNLSYVSILKDNNEEPYGFIYIDSEKNVTEYYYTFDGVGNIMGIIDGNGILACMYEYDALGNATCFDIESPICNGEEKSFMNLNPLLAKCYLYDEHSKLYINKNSYYSPELGKTTNKNVNVYTYSNVFDCNPYAFCNNNFITKVSTDGLDYKYTVDDLNDSIISKKPIINPVVFK